MNMFARFCALTLTSIFIVNSSAQTESFPSRRITLVVPFSAGGAGDQLARALANNLSNAWKQPVVVENRSGSNGIVATQTVVRAAPDGYTLLLHNTTLVQLLGLMKNPGYEPFHQLEPVAHIGTQPIAIAVSAQSPFKTISQLLDAIRTGKVKAYGSFGTGSTGHIYGEQLKSGMHADMTHVPYRGESPMLVDLIPDRIPFGWISGATARATLKDNTIRVLAITGPTRSAELKDIPTLGEVGVEGFDVVGWWGLFAPAGTPEGVTTRIASEVKRTLSNPEFRATLNQQVIAPSTLSPKAFAASMTHDSQWWSGVIGKYGIRID